MALVKLAKTQCLDLAVKYSSIIIISYRVWVQSSFDDFDVLNLMKMNANRTVYCHFVQEMIIYE